jgi:hypothetical protein
MKLISRAKTALVATTTVLACLVAHPAETIKPGEISDGKLSLPEPREWTLDVATGEAKIKQ